MTQRRHSSSDRPRQTASASGAGAGAGAGISADVGVGAAAVSASASDLSGAGGMGSSSVHAPLAAPKSKKRRVLMACNRCSAKKTKCDGRQPCSVCTALGLGDQCQFNPNPKKRGPPKGYWAAQRKMRQDAESRLCPSDPPHADVSTATTPAPRCKSSNSDTFRPPPPKGPAPWAQFTDPAQPEFASSLRAGRQEELAGLSLAANSSSRPRLLPLSHMPGLAPPPSSESARPSNSTDAPRNIFGLNPPPSAVTSGSVQEPQLTPLEARLVEIYIAFVHDHWPLLAPNILFAPGLGGTDPDPAPAATGNERPKTLSVYIASLKVQVPLLFQIICCVSMSTLTDDEPFSGAGGGGGGMGANIVAGIPLQPGEVVTGADLAKLVDKCRVALLPYAHIRAVWVVQALFLLALADYSAGRMHEGWQSTGLVCRLVFDMNLHSRQGEAAVERMMRLATAHASNRGGSRSGQPPTASSINLAAQANAKRRTARFMQTMLADIAFEEQVTAQDERAMYAVAGAYTVDEMIQVRRRIFWCSYVLDKLVSVITERPCMLRSSEVDVGFPMSNGLDDTQPWLTRSSVMFVQPNVIPELKGVSARLNSSFSVVSQLCVITEHILDAFYSPARRALGKIDLRDDRSTSTRTTEWWEVDSMHQRDEGAALASKWFADLLALWGSSGGAGDVLSLPDPQKALGESYLRIMRMITLWSEYMPAPMRARRMPLTYAQPPPPTVNPLGPCELLVMPPRHKGAPPNFLTMRAWTHLNVLLLHRPFIAHPHLLHFDLPTLRKYGFAPALPNERESAQESGPGPARSEESCDAPRDEPKPTGKMKVSITSLLVEQRRQRSKHPRPIPSTSTPSSATAGSAPSMGGTFFLSLSHPAQVCIQAASEIIDIADVYKRLYPPRKLPSVWVYMLFQAGTIVSSFSISVTARAPARSCTTSSTATSAPAALQTAEEESRKRARETAMRCRRLLTRCVSLLDEIGRSHPSARKLVRILQSLSDVSSTVDAAAASASRKPSEVRQPPQPLARPAPERHRLSVPLDGWKASQARQAPPRTGFPHQPSPGTSPPSSSIWGSMGHVGAGVPSSRGLHSPAAETTGANVPGYGLAGPGHLHIGPQATSCSKSTSSHDASSNGLPQDEGDDALLLLAGQAEAARPYPAAPDPGFGADAGDVGTEDHAKVSERVWEPFWSQMPFGENWDSWRTFFTQVADEPIADAQLPDFAHLGPATSTDFPTAPAPFSDLGYYGDLAPQYGPPLPPPLDESLFPVTSPQSVPPFYGSTPAQPVAPQAAIMTPGQTSGFSLEQAPPFEQHSMSSPWSVPPPASSSGTLLTQSYAWAP